MIQTTKEKEKRVEVEETNWLNYAISFEKKKRNKKACIIIIKHFFFLFFFSFYKYLKNKMKNFEFKKRVDSIDYTLLILNENLIVNANSNLKSWEMKISKEEKQNLLQFNNNWENLKILIQKMFEVKKKKKKKE